MSEVTNPELLLYALWNLRATGKYVDIEDAIAEAYRLSPSKFGWRTRDFPSDKTGDQALRDLQKAEGKGRILISENRDLQLTAEGVEWVQANLIGLEAAVAAGVLAGTERPSQRPLVELESVEWVRAYASGEDVALSRVTAAKVLHLTPDASPRAWRERVDALRSAAQRSRRELILAFLERLEHSHPDWFGRGS